MDKRGQITIEAIFLVGLFIVVLATISFPMLHKAKRTAVDVTMVSDARYATEQIASAANSIATPGAKRNISVYIPGYNSTARIIITTIGLDADGSELTTTVLIPNEETPSITQELYGDGWIMYNLTSGTTGNLTEGFGGWYDIVITWKNITFARRG